LSRAKLFYAYAKWVRGITYTMNRFGEWLVEEMKKAGIRSQSELARRAGASDAAISDVLSGRRNLGLDLARAIAEALDLDPVDVLYAAGLLPKPKENLKDKWVRRIERKLEGITDPRDREIVERTIDVLSPEKQKKGRQARNESSP
jgi:transcriptional regulator with XRE-family HTH domain